MNFLFLTFCCLIIVCTAAVLRSVSMRFHAAAVTTGQHLTSCRTAVQDVPTNPTRLPETKGYRFKTFADTLCKSDSKPCNTLYFNRNLYKAGNASLFSPESFTKNYFSSFFSGSLKLQCSAYAPDRCTVLRFKHADLIFNGQSNSNTCSGFAEADCAHRKW
ncbi:hypothetical protein [Cyclonatronum proteinivorum]|uniref:hypothetical protein n=1 Tax=Cyclonatronum proteinivorum TaxID=1457365 RepID=UPI0013DFD406|nr:hypothetical protein [Cyclonatronum proteinivorum]